VIQCVNFLPKDKTNAKAKETDMMSGFACTQFDFLA